MVSHGETELGEHDRPRDPPVGGDPEGMAGMVIEPGEISASPPLVPPAATSR